MASDASIKKELAKKFGDTVTTGQLGQYNREYLRWAREGGLDLVSRGVWAITPKGAQQALDDDDDEDELATEADEVVDAALIKKRFEMLSKLGDGVVNSNIRSLIVSGSAGVGKTFELEKKLKQAEKEGKIKSFDTTKGTMSAIGLYQMLYLNRKKGQVTLLDDTDRVFYDEEAINILKAALDTSAVRTISWAKASKTLTDSDTPNKFDYEGSVIFISNIDLDKIVAKGGRLAPHINALISRSIFLDLAIHSPKAIMVRIEQVLKDSTLAADLGLTPKEVNELVKWMTDNLDTLRHVSIREVGKISMMMKVDSANWKEMALTTLTKGRM
jgi:hypothetical protein